MKKIVTILGAFALAGGLAFAQGPMGGGQGGPQGGMPDMSEMMDAGKIAERQAGQLKDQIGLDETQYKKVYKLYKSAAQKKINEMQSSMPSGMGGGMSGGMGGGMMGGPGGGMGGGMMGGGMPGGGMGGPGGMGGGMPGGMPSGDQSGMQNGEQRGPRGGMGMMNQPEDEKTIAKRNKKMSKILSADQYNKYLQIQEQQQAELEKRAMERQDGMPQGR